MAIQPLSNYKWGKGKCCNSVQQLEIREMFVLSHSIFNLVSPNTKQLSAVSQLADCKTETFSPHVT